MVDNLIIAAELVNPPSDILAFRTFTMLARIRLGLYNLILVEREFKDIYYHYMREKGIYDYVAALITPEEDEVGIRVECSHNYSFTVITDRVDWSNLNTILGQVINLNNMIND